jgi:hypothetical protein
MLLVGTLSMGFWLFLVGGLQARFGQWSILDGSRTFVNLMASVWIHRCCRHLGC